MPARLVKICIGPCGRELPIEWFHKNKNYKDGRTSRCKDCINARRRRPGAIARDGVRPDGTRRCSRCRVFKSSDEYSFTTDSGKRYVCDACRPAYTKDVWYRHKYGIDLATFEALVAAQYGRCAICRRTMDVPCLDHCHETGEIRGVLCVKCNQALGLLQENPTNVMAALVYLGRNRAS